MSSLNPSAPFRHACLSFSLSVLQTFSPPLNVLNDKFLRVFIFFCVIIFFFFTKEDASFRRMKSLYMCAYKGAIVHLYVNYGVTISVLSVFLFLNRQRELKGGRTKT